MLLTDKLAPNFTFGEMTFTKQSALLAQNREEAIPFLERGFLIAAILQKIRDHFKRPVNVHSAFRCADLNGATKGASKVSQHMKFEACDFDVEGFTLLEVFRWIRDESGLKVGQCLLEGRTPGGSPTWIHISLGAPWRDPARCGQFLTYDGKTYRDASRL